MRSDGESPQFWLQWPFCLCHATVLSYRKELEARAGIEPAHKGFADLSLTTWVPRLGPGSSHTAVHLVDICQGGAEWSGRRDLNSRPSPWQGDALPLSYSRLTQIRVYRAAESGSNRQPRRVTAFGQRLRRMPWTFDAAPRQLTGPRNSRRLRDCEGCGSKGLPPASFQKTTP